MDIVKLKKLTTKSDIRKQTEENTIYFIVIKITEKLCNKIKQEIGAIHDYVYDKIKGEEFENYNTHILFIGNIDKYPHYKDIVYKYKKKYHGGTSVYRNYCTSRENQEKTRLFVNVAEDADTCWNTVKSALGAKTIKDPCYGVIVQLQERLTNIE